MNFAARMPPNHQFMINALPMEPVSRTYQYRKIMKPMLERKRRARINKCLDELKDLMTGTLQADGENVSKLEKADILELTVRHLQRLREKNALYVRHTDTLNMEKFWAGFQHCAAEVAQFLNKFDHQISGDLIQHIANYAPNLNTILQPQPQPQPPSPGVAVPAASRLPSSAYLANRVVTANYQRLSYTEMPRSVNIPNIGLEMESPARKRHCGEESWVKKEILDDQNGPVWRPW